MCKLCLYIYNVVILLPFKSCGNQAMPCLHFFHGSFYISTILREQWPMTKVWKFPLHPALQFGTDPGLKGWTYPSLWESDGERTNEFLLAIGDFERLDLLSACSLATTHCHAWSTVDICWHLLTSVDICWHLLTSVDHTDVVRITNVLRRSLLVSSVPLSSYSGIRAGRRFASLARPNSTWFDRDIRDRNASWHRSWDPNCVQGPRWRPSYRNAR